jgi:hypothetical protein
MRQFGLPFLNAYMYAAYGGQEGWNRAHPDELDILDGPFTQNPTALNLMSPSADCQEFFRWLVPDNRPLSDNGDQFLTLPRPKGVKAHTFHDFAICLDNLVSTFTTQWGGGKMFHAMHGLEDANNMWEMLSMPEHNSEMKVQDFRKLFSDFFLCEKVGEDGYTFPLHKFKFVMHEHAFLLPDSNVLIQYLDRLLNFMEYEEDKTILRQAQKFLY